ncbi:unnamed protein product, partial [Mesorhabditis spiculigera]
MPADDPHGPMVVKKAQVRWKSGFPNDTHPVMQTLRDTLRQLIHSYVGGPVLNALSVNVEFNGGAANVNKEPPPPTGPQVDSPQPWPINYADPKNKRNAKRDFTKQPPGAAGPQQMQLLTDGGDAAPLHKATRRELPSAKQYAVEPHGRGVRLIEPPSDQKPNLVIVDASSKAIRERKDSTCSEPESPADDTLDSIQSLMMDSDQHSLVYTEGMEAGTFIPGGSVDFDCTLNETTFTLQAGF